MKIRIVVLFQSLLCMLISVICFIEILLIMVK